MNALAKMLGFLNFFLWASDLWFLYKETSWFKLKQGSNSIMNEIEYGFEQPGFEKYLQLEESLLIAPASWDEHISNTIFEFGISVLTSVKESLLLPGVARRCLHTIDLDRTVPQSRREQNYYILEMGRMAHSWERLKVIQFSEMSFSFLSFSRSRTNTCFAAHRDRPDTGKWLNVHDRSTAFSLLPVPFGETYNFEDACESQPIPFSMDLDVAMEEARAAVNFFFNNKFDEARAILKPWADTSMLNVEEVYLHLCGERVENHIGINTLSTPNWDSNLNLPVFGSPIYSESGALDHVATEMGFRSTMGGTRFSGRVVQGVSLSLMLDWSADDGEIGTLDHERRIKTTFP
uniref:Uncharacterized protein n=1 Tax=Timema bartmani TaxID=61472 RepID=A0A7R9F525_9NEOP|nr:unnamed protein product [Timema bartmani]